MAWKAVGGEATSVAKDLWASHCGDNNMHAEMDGKLKTMETATHRIRVTRGMQKMRGNTIATIHDRRCLLRG